MFTNAKSKLLFAGWTWVTPGSNKLKEKTIYDEKQRVAITEQRQYDLLSNVVSNSWSFGLLKSRYNVTQQMKSIIDNLFLLHFKMTVGVNTWEFCSHIVKLHDLFSNYYKGEVGENSEMHNHRSQTLRPDATAPAKTQRNKQIYPHWNLKLTLN